MVTQRSVILSAATDLMPVASGDEIRRCDQDDSAVLPPPLLTAKWPALIALIALTPAAAARSGVRAYALRLHGVRDHLAHHRRQRPFGHAVDRAPARAGRQPGQTVGRGGGARPPGARVEIPTSVGPRPL